MAEYYDNFDCLNDYERGELDCVLGYPALDNESEDYYLGYGHYYGMLETQTGAECYV
jgi:hypothetical protein